MIDVLNKWSVRIGLGTLVLSMFGLWKGYGVVHAYHEMITGTAEAVQLMAKQFALGDIEDEMADLRSEKRDYRLEKKLATKPDIAETYQMLIDEIDLELISLGEARRCIINNPDISLCKKLRK